MSIFCLPAELRDMVYKHIVAGHEIKMDPQPGRSAVAPPAEFATLQLISRQVQKESIAIYYGFNFSLDPLRRSDCIYRYDWTAKVSNDTVSGIGSASNTLGHVQCRTDTRTLRTSTRTYRPLETNTWQHIWIADLVPLTMHVRTRSHTSEGISDLGNRFFSLHSILSETATV
jgi:hypothetical protein